MLPVTLTGISPFGQYARRDSNPQDFSVLSGAELPVVHSRKKLGRKESNLLLRFIRPPCNPYTTTQYVAWGSNPDLAG